MPNVLYRTERREDPVSADELILKEQLLIKKYHKTKNYIKEMRPSFIPEEKVEYISDKYQKGMTLPNGDIFLETNSKYIFQHFWDITPHFNEKVQILAIDLEEYHLVNVIFYDDIVLNINPEEFMSFQIGKDGRVQSSTKKEEFDDFSLALRTIIQHFLISFMNNTEQVEVSSKVIEVEEKMKNGVFKNIKISNEFYENLTKKKSMVDDISILKEMPFNRMKIILEDKDDPLYLFVFKEGNEILFWISYSNNFKSLSSLLVSYSENLNTNKTTIFKGGITKGSLSSPEGNIDDFCHANTCIVLEVIKYINSPKTTINKEKPRPLNVLAKPPKRSNDVIYINKREYTYDEPSDNEKREYEHHVKECSVRGHWRRYRNEKGEVTKKIWIEPHKRTFDDGAEENNKVYKI